MKCRICENSQGNLDYNVREMMFGLREVFHYLECSSCGCLQIEDFPSDMSRFYSAKYYSFSAPKSGRKIQALKNYFKTTFLTQAIYKDGRLGKAALRVLSDLALRSLARCSISKGSKILDVGCGSGTLLYTLRESGARYVLGIDPYIESDIRYANGLTIQKKFLHEVEGQWDLIMFHHSFEHLIDPKETLRICETLLAKGGRCLIRMPTVSSYAWKHYGTNWAQLDAPRHFFLFSVDSLKLVAQQAGLELESTYYDSWEFQFWGSEQYKRDIPLEAANSYGKNPRGSIFSPTELKVFSRRSAELNAQGLGDQAVFLLRRCAERDRASS